jgi:hypothetical protein
MASQCDVEPQKLGVLKFRTQQLIRGDDGFSPTCPKNGTSVGDIEFPPDGGSTVNPAKFALVLTATLAPLQPQHLQRGIRAAHLADPVISP